MAPLVRTILLRHVNANPTMTVQGFSMQETDRDDLTAVVVDIYSTVRNERAAGRPGQPHQHQAGDHRGQLGQIDLTGVGEWRSIDRRRDGPLE